MASSSPYIIEGWWPIINVKAQKSVRFNDQVEILGQIKRPPRKKSTKKENANDSIELPPLQCSKLYDTRDDDDAYISSSRPNSQYSGDITKLVPIYRKKSSRTSSRTIFGTDNLVNLSSSRASNRFDLPELGRSKMTNLASSGNSRHLVSVPELNMQELLSVEDVLVRMLQKYKKEESKANRRFAMSVVCGNQKPLQERSVSVRGEEVRGGLSNIGLRSIDDGAVVETITIPKIFQAHRRDTSGKRKMAFKSQVVLGDKKPIIKNMFD